MVTVTQDPQDMKGTHLVLMVVPKVPLTAVPMVALIAALEEDPILLRTNIGGTEGDRQGDTDLQGKRSMLESTSSSRR